MKEASNAWVDCCHISIRYVIGGSPRRNKENKKINKKHNTENKDNKDNKEESKNHDEENKRKSYLL